MPAASGRCLRDAAYEQPRPARTVLKREAPVATMTKEEAAARLQKYWIDGV